MPGGYARNHFFIMNVGHDQSTIGQPAVLLLRGILYRERAEAWELLLRYRGALEDYFAVLGLQLLVDEAEGYAYLLQQPPEDTELPETETLPRLLSRRPLSYNLTLLLVLLRRRLLEFEAAGNESRLVLTQQDIIDLVRVYWNDVDTNERKREDTVISNTKRMVKYGFLEQLKAEKERFEVMPILKAYLPVEELNDILQKLKTYAQQRYGSSPEIEE